MDAKPAPAYIIRRKPPKRSQELVPRPSYPPTPSVSTQDDLTELLRLLTSRQWVGNKGDFRLVSYNLLSDAKIASKPALFTHCPGALLTSSSRINRFLSELHHLPAHIYTLQGVNQYQSDLLTAFDGFEAVFTGTEGGVAILYDTRRFEMQFNAKVELKSAGHSVLNTANYGLIAVLRHKITQKEVLIATISTDYSEKMTQFGQIMVICKAIEDVMRQKAGISVILTGSFDCNPGSGVYNYLSTGKISSADLDITRLTDWDRWDTEKVGVGDGVMRAELREGEGRVEPEEVQRLHLSRTGVEVLREGGVRYLPSRLPHIPTPLPEFTTGLGPLHNAYFDHIPEPLPTLYSGSVLLSSDYIWHNAQRITAVSVLKTPSVSSITRFPSAPNQVFPSDHIVLAVEFDWV